MSAAVSPSVPQFSATVSPYSQIPAGVASSFRGLCNVPFRAFIPLLKLNDAGKLQERILVVTDEVIFVATADGQIRRGVPLEWLAELYWHKEQRMLVFVCPSQYDMCVKLDPTYSSIGKDASMRLLGTLATLSDDWPRLAVLIAKLREKRCASLYAENTDSLSPPTQLKMTPAVGEAANRAFRLKKPDGQFHAVLRTGSSSSLVALPEDEIARRAELSTSLELSNQSSIVCGETTKIDEDDGEASSPSLMQSVRWNVAETPLSASTAAIELNFAESAADAVPVQHSAAPQSIARDEEPRSRECEPSDPKEYSDSGRPRKVVAAGPGTGVQSDVQTVVHQDEVRVVDLPPASPSSKSASGSPSGDKALPSCCPSDGSNLGNLFTHRTAPHVPEIAQVVVLAPSPPEASSQTNSSSSLSSPPSRVAPLAVTPNPSTTRQQLSTGGPITINSVACANILEYVMQLEKDRDWWQTQAESVVEENSRLQRALENAKVEVMWYRQRFLAVSTPE